MKWHVLRISMFSIKILNKQVEAKTKLSFYFFYRKYTRKSLSFKRSVRTSKIKRK